VDLASFMVHIAPMFGRQPLTTVLRITASVLLASALLPLLIGARARTPRDKSPGRATRNAVAAAKALTDRPAEEWAALESRYDSGQISADELRELRIFWASTDTRRFARSTWTLQLLQDGLDGPTAVHLPVAVLEGDLQSVDEVVATYSEVVDEPRAEILLMHAAALWGMGREGGAALVYHDALANDSVLTYYDTTVEEWLRGRAQDVVQGREEAFVPTELARAEALRQDLQSRGTVGQLLVAFLRAAPPPEGGYTPSAALDDDVVVELFGTRRAALYFCYEKAGGEQRLGNGAVLVDMDVDSMGRVEFCAVQPASEIKDRTLWDCSCDVASSLQFPCPVEVGKATVRYRLDFPIAD